jgi:hypothetical protein
MRQFEQAHEKLFRDSDIKVGSRPVKQYSGSMIDHDARLKIRLEEELMKTLEIV